jgi:hypothetical protein
MVVQVISIGPDGSMSGLQHKRNSGVDMRAFGKTQIARASEIQWSDTHQAWMVVIQDAPSLEHLKGLALTGDMIDEAGMRSIMEGFVKDDKALPITGDGGALLFVDYEDGVEFEVMFLNTMRKRGFH